MPDLYDDIETAILEAMSRHVPALASGRLVDLLLTVETHDRTITISNQRSHEPTEETDDA